MGLILDTNVFIRAEKQAGQIDFNTWADHGEVFISVITASELLVGVHCADSPERRARRAAFVETLLSKIPSLPLTIEVARVHAELYAQLMRQGGMIGAHDLIIAATAVCAGYPVLTGNVVEYGRVPGLVVLAV